MPETTPSSPPAPLPADVDVLVVGAGFGGLGAAMGLLDRGACVLVCERLDYPGGCAGTFTRRGGRYDAGATLSSGFGPGQLFAGWAGRHAMDLRVSPLDPVVELRAPGLTLPVWADRARFVDTIAGLAGAHADAVRRFFAYQAGVAATLWRVLDDPGLLPPLGAGGALAHLRHLGGYLPVARWLGRPLTAVLARFGLEHVAPLRLFCDAVCQITVQCPAHEAEAPFALATLDYFFRGVAHVHGGIGELARAIVAALTRRGADVRYHCPVRALARDGDRWRVDTRRGPVRARAVVANLLPQALLRLLAEPGPAAPPLQRLTQSVDTGWGAAMLYLVVRPPAGAPPHAHHLELIDDPAAPLIEGNHLFASISGADEPDRAPPGRRVVTVSTHLPAALLRELPPAEYLGRVHERMRAVFAARAPEWAAGIEQTMTASPRTFERYTGRPGGLVGGVPRRTGLHNYTGAWPRPLAPGLWLVGDSVFPGQSTLATALGGLRTAAALAPTLGLRARDES
jgi:phytoene dehydrogenase-like protein